MMHLKTLCKLYSDNSKCLAEFKATGKQSKMHVKCLHVLCMYYTMFFIYTIGFKVIIIILTCRQIKLCCQEQKQNQNC